MKTLSILLTLASIALLAVVMACESSEPHDQVVTVADASKSDQPASATSAYARAMAISLSETQPRSETGLHNIYVLSDQIISGSEPEGKEAFAELAQMGVKVILSVDGKTPDLEAAKAYGMRYVHAPIEYSGMSAEEIGNLTKTFRDLEGPFYVHCFHGRHRGPAAAALGRIVVDNASRDLALAEMRQWCGTSGKYQGLYDTVGTAKIPDAAETAELDWDFPEQQVLDGFRAIMVAVPRAHDRLKELKKRAFAADPAHPDVDALNEAQKLRDLYVAAQNLPETAHEEADYLGWLKDSVDASHELVTTLEALKAGKGNGDYERRAESALDRITAACAACHAEYRD